MLVYWRILLMKSLSAPKVFWRQSVGWQQDLFIRRGGSKRSKQRHEKVEILRKLWSSDDLKLDCILCKENNPPADNNLRCCARRILFLCDDFKVDKCWLEETAGNALLTEISLKFHRDAMGVYKNQVAANMHILIQGLTNTPPPWSSR